MTNNTENKERPNVSTTFQQLASRLGQSFDQTSETGSLQGIFPQLLQLLAKGKPLTIEEIASVTGKTVEEMRQIIPTLSSVELDEQGRVVGYGLTLIPTPHSFKVDGKQLYAWCALDTLMFPGLIGRSAHIESPCHSTGKPVLLTVEPGRIVKVEPSTAVVSIVTPDDMSAVRSAFCNEVHFFSSPSAAQDWLNQHPGGKVISVEDAFKLGNLMGKNYEKTGPSNGSCCHI